MSKGAGCLVLSLACLPRRRLRIVKVKSNYVPVPWHRLIQTCLPQNPQQLPLPQTPASAGETTLQPSLNKFELFSLLP